MSQVEEMLRGALSTAPSPTATTPDPLADLERRVGRARVRLGGVALAVVVVLVAAVVVPLSLLGGSSSGPAEVSGQTWAPGADLTSLTSGGGFVWTIAHTTTAGRSRFTAQKRNPQTGRIVATYRLSAGNQLAAFGTGALWDWGSGSGRFPHAIVEQLELSDSAFNDVDLSGFGDGILPTPHRIGLTFAGDLGYGVKARGQLIAAFQNGDLTTALPGGLKVPGVLSVLAAHGTLLAVGEDRVLGEYPTDAGWPPPPQNPDQATTATTATEPIKVKGLPLVGSAKGLWALDGGQLVQEDLDGHQIGAAVRALPMSTAGPRPALDVEQADVVVDKAGGLYVALPSPATFGDRPDDLVYYSPAALATADPQPTAVHVSTGLIDAISVDPSGGIVYNGTSLGHWNPAAA